GGSGDPYPDSRRLPRVRVIDVMHLGRPHVIGCWEVEGALVDPGPESSIETVLEAIDDEQPRALLLTHIHLDHAAATGALVRRWPDLEVYVHERGAPHLIDPSKLLASAERLYGDKLNYLWGEILPVPERNVRVLTGGETVLGVQVAYTPGHASHHVCYFHEDSGTAFCGDVAACQIPPSNLIVPPTPPPDIDVETWEQSLDTVAAWQPQRLALTHFGAVEDDVPGHIEAVRAKLRGEAELARQMTKEAYDADNEARIRRQLAEEGIGDDTVDELLQAVPTAYQWSGLDRYWRKKAEREATAAS
ncbi:MAG TPA: MBL fold metallo-hydrolase, partial [Solirubrobacterales bacterium]|nr:MBL fold metallo-hydrolase [Solirubrobacterales bacterium]